MSAVVESSPATATPSKAARAGAAMGLATLAMAGASAIQAVLYLSSFGLTARTDAFFAAFSLYTVFGVFTQSIRITAVPLLVGRGQTMGPRDFAVTLLVIAVPVALACGPLAGPLAGLLAPGVSEADQGLTQNALHILGGAMVLQLAAAGAATVLGLWDRFGTVAAGYMAGAPAGLITYLVAEPSTGELTLGWSMLAMAVVTAAWMGGALLRARTPGQQGGIASPTRLTRMAGGILGRTVVYFVFNGLFLITLAFASHSDAGDATVLSYGYLFVSYLVAGTGMAVGVSRVPDMTRGAQDDWHDVVADTVPHGFRYAILLCAPAVGALVAGGAALVGELVPASLPPGEVGTLREFAALLAPWMLAALLVNLALPALFALGRARLVNLVALPVVLLHLLATWVGDRLFGVEGAVGAFCIAPLVFAVFLVGPGVGRRRALVVREIARDTVVFGVLAVAAFGLGGSIGLALPAGLLSALVAVGVGSAAYLAGLRLAAPHQLEVLLGARRATGPEAATGTPEPTGSPG